MKKLAIAGMIVTSLALAACQATETTATTKADTTASIGKTPLARDFTANLVRVQEFGSRHRSTNMALLWSP